MKRMLFFVIFISILLTGCLNNNANKGHTIGIFLKQFQETNTFQYNVITRETFNNENINGKTSYANFIFKKNPYYRSYISITQNQNTILFVKSNEEYSDKLFELSRFVTEIDKSNYCIDALGSIVLKKEFEDSIKLKTESIKNIPQSIKQANDPFHMMIYLFDQNLDSFKLDDTNDLSITYSGYFEPDSLVNYYINDGNKVFREVLFTNYDGQMTREALRTEIINDNYSELANPLNALLFTNEPIPITITKNIKENTYEITLNTTNAQKSLYKTMYSEVKSQPASLDKSLIKYSNIILNN